MKQIQILKMNQIEALEMKNFINQIKSTDENLIDRPHQVKQASFESVEKGLLKYPSWKKFIKK